MLDELLRSLRALRLTFNEQTPQLAAIFGAEGDYVVQLRRFLDNAEQLLSERQKGYQREQHAQYGALFQAWRTWAQTAENARELLRGAPARLYTAP